MKHFIIAVAVFCVCGFVLIGYFRFYPQPKVTEDLPKKCLEAKIKYPKIIVADGIFTFDQLKQITAPFMQDGELNNFTLIDSIVNAPVGMDWISQGTSTKFMGIPLGCNDTIKNNSFNFNLIEPRGE